MEPAAEQSEREWGIPQLAEDWDPIDAELSPAEGFLLSRIDGHTPWTQLRQIAGIPAQDVDACIERWLTQGVVKLVAGRPQPSKPPAIDSSLDIPTDLQQEILEFAASLDRPYFELLGVAHDADSQEIKRAYFRLSKIFHPDRYFRREIGAFAGYLDRIFRKLVEAYELLSDPATRAEIERSQASAPPAAAISDGSGGSGETPFQPVETPKKLTRRQTLERLRRHFKMPESVMLERRSKASQFYETAMVAVQRGRWREAAPCVRLAIAFDPWNDTYRAQFAEIQSRSHRQRVDEMLDESADGWDPSNRIGALRLLEEILVSSPADPAVNHQAAELALAIGDAEKSMEYGEIAIDLSPGSAAIMLTVARAARRLGMREKAMTNLKKAAQLDPEDSEIRAELNDLRRARKRS